MGQKGTFVFPIHDLDVAGKDAEFPITLAWLRGALEGCEMQPAGPEGRFDAHFQKTGNEVLVQGQIEVALVVPCARCLKAVEFRPHAELSLLLYPGSQPAPAKSGRGPDREGELAGDEADVDTYEGDEVVLDRFVREAILLESPTFPLCSEACEGIRPASESASATRVTDPRLLPLLELAKRQKEKE